MPSGTKRQLGSLTFTLIAQWRVQEPAVFARLGARAFATTATTIPMKLLTRLTQCHEKLLAGVFLFIASPLAFAAMTNVNIQLSAFDPPVVDINVNDQVKWTWVSSPHSATSDDALWDSGVH